MTGEAVRLLVRFGRRYAAVVRVATLPPIAVIGLLRAAPEHLAATVPVVGVAVVWTCCCAWLSRTVTGRALLVVDVTVLLAVCLSVFWTDAVADTNTGWIRLLVTFACVTWQWHTPPLAGGAAALVVGGGMLAVVAAAGGGPNTLRGLVWVLVVAMLSRVAWTLVVRAAARADRIAAEAEHVRREAAVAAAVRAEERELANTLHDTAATTLLMVGTGQVPAGAPWLPEQARRDLDRLNSGGTPPPEHADLVDLLRTDAEVTQLTVELHVPERLPLPFDVATAIADAAREAVNNVRRHAGTDRATVRLDGDERALSLQIADEGTGFAVDGVPGTRRGLRESVHGRMSRIGGSATVSSVEGAGTVVRLGWGSGS
ncbi:MAG TPA: ATP-binding protein [Actinophytocola sp.]|nr:ATP-binding protein [Actinophytocola sp.]